MATPNKPSYSLYKPLSNNRYLVRRTTDGELLLAQSLDPDTTANANDNANNEHERTRTLLRHGAGEPAAALLNHENIVSIHDELVTIPLTAIGAAVQASPHNNNTDMDTTMQKRMFLYDYCDAGTLQDVFDEYEPPFHAQYQQQQAQQQEDNNNNNNPLGHERGIRTRENQLVSAVTAAGGFLPESFIWHVGLSLLRGLQWLHEGVRETYNVLPGSGPSAGSNNNRCKRVRGRSEPEADWMPVLHRDVTAGNVFLQHPRGVETYGAVKLGNFGKCWVSGGVARSRETPVVAAGEEGGDGVAVGVLRGRVERWKREGLGVRKAERPYTRGSELFAVGALLYRMMCARPLPAGDECPDCGCVHLTSNDAEEYVPCGHDCVSDVNIDEVFKPLFNYTADLKQLVILLLRLNHTDEWYASTVLDYAWPGFEHWAANTEDGRLYRDIFDDIWFRKQNQAKLKKRRHRDVEEDEAMGGTELDYDVLVV